MRSLAGFAFAEDSNAGSSDETVSTGQVHVMRDDAYGALYIEPTIEEFNAMGFQFGDTRLLQLIHMNIWNI